MDARLITQWVWIVVVTGGCVSPAGQTRDERGSSLENHSVAALSQVSACRAALAEASDRPARELDPGSLDLLVWNIHKGAHHDWLRDLRRLSHGKDLVLIQEAMLRPAELGTMGADSFWSFAPGYQTSTGLSGVATLSTTKPLARCNLTTREPWLRTPKATNVAEFGLADTDQTLLVVNVHAINFTFGVQEFTEQLEQVAPLLAVHDGPIIFSGDFNTWRAARMQVVDKLVEANGLSAISFEDDHRLRIFGNPLDHIYVRGLKPVEATSQPVTTSDHNPLSARFRLAN